MKSQDDANSRFQESPICEVLASITQSHRVTEKEQAVFRKAFLEESLTEEDHKIINRLHYALRRGKITLSVNA